MIHAPSALVKWQPDLEFLLLDEGAYTEERLDEIGSLVALIFEADTVKNIHAGRKIFQQIGAFWKRTPYSKEVAESLQAWLVGAFERKNLGTAIIEELLGGGVNMLAENIEKWYEQAKKEGLQEGLQKGHKKGREEGRTEGLKEAVIALYHGGMEVEVIASTLKLPTEKIQAWIVEQTNNNH